MRPGGITPSLLEHPSLKRVAPPFPTSSSPTVSTVVRIGLTLLFVAGAALSLQGGWHQIAEYSWQLDGRLIALALCLYIVSTLLGNLVWVLLMRSFGAPIEARPALRVYCTSNLGKYLPGKVWHVFARIYLAQQYGAPLARATSGSVTDVLIFVAAGGVISVLAVPSIVGWTVEPALLALLVGAAAAAVLVVLHPTVLKSVLAVAGRFIPRLRDLHLEIEFGAVLRILALDLVLWGVICAGVYATVHAVFPLSITQAPTLAAIYAVSYTSGLIMPLAPAGLGVREGAFALLLAPIVGVPAAAVSTALIRVLQVAAEAVCAAAFHRL